jgi:hypothetical protein
MPKILHGIFSKLDKYSNDVQTKAEKYIKSPEFNEKTYLNLLSGKYNDDIARIIEVLPSVKKSKYNTKSNNDKIISNVLNFKQKDDADFFWKAGYIEYFLRHLKHSTESVNKIINFVKNKKKIPTEEKTNLLRSLNKSSEIKKTNIKDIIDTVPNDPTGASVINLFINHPSVDSKIFNEVLKKFDFNSNRLPGGVLTSKFLTSEAALKILNDTDTIGDSNELDKLLSKLPKSARNDYIHSKLGITGGSKSPSPEEYETDWFHGPERDEITARTISESKYLTPEAINHIKKHGGFGEKYGLFSNEHVDPKHAAEMAAKWANDEDGYEESDFKERLKEDNQDNVWDNYSDDAREKVQEEYPISKYLRDIGDDEVSRTLFDKDHDEWKKDWIKENKDLTGPNPDFNPEEPESEDNPKNITFNEDEYDIKYPVEDHPNYSDYDSEAEEAFENAKNHADLEPFYDGYDESINENVSDAVSDLFDDELDNWTEHDHFLPEHVRDKLKDPLKGKENPTEKDLEEAIYHPLKIVRDHAAKHEKLSPRLINKVLEEGDKKAKMSVLENPNITSQQLMNVIKKDDDKETVSKALRNFKITPEHVQEAINRHNENSEIMNAAFKSHAANDEHVKNYLNIAKSSKTPYYNDLSPIVNSKFNLSPEDVNFIYNKFNEQGRYNDLSKLVSHHNSTKDIIEQSLKHHDYKVKESAKKMMDRKFPQSADPVNVKMGTHPLRVLRDIVSEQGGTTTKGKLKNLGINPDKFNTLFKPNGTISSDDIQKVIDSAPSKNYNTSHDKWTGAQRHSADPSDVFQLNYTQEHLNEMQKEGVLDTFQKIHEVAMRSGHPVKNNTIGWVRYTGSPEEGFHIDEIQSDLGKSIINQTIQQAKNAVQNNQMTTEQAETAVENAKNKFPEDHLKKINKILFEDKHPSEIIHEAFKEYMRGKGFEKTPIHIWQPESKAPISGMRQSTKISASDAKTALNSAKKDRMDDEAKALISWGQKNKLAPASFKDITHEHLDQIAEKYSDFANAHREQHNSDPELPVQLPVHMIEGYGKIPKAMGYKESFYGKLPTQSNEEYKIKPEINQSAAPTYEDVIRKNEGQPTILHHYSRHQDLKELDPKKEGMGVRGDHTKRFLPYQIKNFPHVTFYYINDTPEQIVKDAAKSKYTVKLEPHQKLYNLHTDPEGLGRQAIAENQGAWNYEKIFNKIKNAGYHGITAIGSEHPIIGNTVMLFHPQAIHEEKKLV